MNKAASIVESLAGQFGEKVRHHIPLAPYTAARIGGPADVLITVESADDLAAVVTRLWEAGAPYFLLGGGSNVLISDQGVRGITLLNRAKAVRFEGGSEPRVWAESGAVFTNLANRCAARGFSGLEWAATVPGTVGGAVYGNAGAFGGDMAHSLLQAEMLTLRGREQWSPKQLAYGYRTSILKRGEIKAIVLAAVLGLGNATKSEVSVKIGQFSERRKSTQPPGASMGSMFKNPEGEAAGRLIEEAGLKGTRIGGAEVSPLHGNFFVNRGNSNASDVHALIELVQKTVREKLGVQLELEIELVGEW
jgi:UDP-N-acetylmuramate dehydrogenase